MEVCDVVLAPASQSPLHHLVAPASPGLFELLGDDLSGSDAAASKMMEWGLLQGAGSPSPWPTDETTGTTSSGGTGLVAETSAATAGHWPAQQPHDGGHFHGSYSSPELRLVPPDTSTAPSASGKPPSPSDAGPLAAGGRRRGRKPKPRVDDLEEALNQRLAEFKKLSEENTFLRNKLKLLEKVVPVRDESVGFLTRVSSLMTAAAAASVGVPQPPVSVVAGGQHDGNAAAEYCPSPNGFVPDISTAGLERLRRLTPQQFQQVYKRISVEFAVLVLGVEAHGPGSAAHTKLCLYMRNALDYIDKITLLSPDVYFKSMYVNLETGAPERPPDGFWLNVARSLGLSAQQLGEIVPLVDVFQRNVTPVIDERRALSAQLAGALASPQALAGGASSAIDELTNLLAKNVLKEHQRHWDVGDFLCAGVLNPLQVAKALVVSLPFVPDGVAILHACKALAEERQAGNAEAGQAGQAQQQGGQQQTQQQQQQMGLWG